jgi:cytochrome c2
MRWLSLTAVLLAGGAVLAGCGNAPEQHQLAQARILIANNCGACHSVPGIAGADGRVGPPLAGIGTRQIIAGHFANTPNNLVSWIEHPQAMLPGDAMPEMGLSHAQAQAVASYLYTLED